MRAWLLLRDIVLTGIGVWLILAQEFSPHPSDVMLTVALVLLAPAAAEHAKALLTGPHTDGLSSPSPSHQPSSPSSSSPGAADEHAPSPGP